ncbi:tRNA (guanosine(37)-N1)-methyltransferase TrmD [bacterium]|nr:tRNA (guanosine(37)-N1)-methyltransferase TrmD [bacterium]MBU1652579.1 tRNA (guanosine(37)-N1)-methyltransferase TrmD [bacterium]
MIVDIITLFPKLFDGFKTETLIKRAQQKGLLTLNVYHLRTWARSKHQQVDDTPFGGGPGMVLKPEPLFLALHDLTGGYQQRPLVTYFTPSGELLNQRLLKELSSIEHHIFICGRYKGVDQRVLDTWVDRQISIGDYVLSGGELPALVTLEGMTRLIPSVINDIESAHTDSFEDDLLEGPLYTRPEEYEGQKVPEVLSSGHHAKIADWCKEKALEKTRKYRPDLWQDYIKKNKQK